MMVGQHGPRSVSVGLQSRCVHLEPEEVRSDEAAGATASAGRVSQPTNRRFSSTRQCVA